MTILKPTPDRPTGHVLRMDAAGSGKWHAPRGGRKHMGVDLLSEPGEPVYAPHGGIVRHSIVKVSRPDMKVVAVRKGHNETKMMYVEPVTGDDGNPLHKPGHRVECGDLIGYAQDTAALYGSQRMKPHVHVEHVQSGRRIDPTPFLLP